MKTVLYIILGIVAIVFFTWVSWTAWNWFANFMGLPTLTLKQFLALKLFVK